MSLLPAGSRAPTDRPGPDLALFPLALRGLSCTRTRRIFFSALAQGLQAHAGGAETLSPALWAAALSSALAKLYTYTRARPPSRTLVDPLAAFVDALARAQGADFAGAARAAGDAALATRDLEAKAGRSAYVEGDRLRQERVPDPGAWGVKVILESLLG